MLTIKENDIYFTRGDTAYLQLDLCGSYKPKETDKVYFSVKKRAKDEDYQFNLVFNYDEAIVIMPEDTKDMSFGRYLYDVEIHTEYNEVFTVLSGYFNLMEEITDER